MVVVVEVVGASAEVGATGVVDVVVADWTAALSIVEVHPAPTRAAITATRMSLFTRSLASRTRQSPGL